ncbi:MAG TPA: protein translocase subunit SecF [Thermomicrobiales bacterium]|nr:protein translocase subunit SecF [Thermomicrobiales bacterium]
MEHLAGKRNVWYAVSAAMLVPSVFALVFWGLQFGIDFTGGSAWEIQYTSDVNTEEITRVLAENGRPEATVQQVGDSDERRYLIRLKELPEGSEEKSSLTAALGSLGVLVPEGESLETVGASVGTSIRNRSVLAVAAAAVGILIYIAWAFRNTQNPILYGICAIVAMLHDALIVLGLFAVLGHFADVEVDALFITALLTVIGFSVHDTIVVFDRIRENLRNQNIGDFEEVVNYSIAQTIVRSLNTSVTVTLTLLALLLFGGSTTREFVLALLVGVVAGTYSSIFNASQLLVSWEKGEIQGLFHRITRTGRGVAPEVSSQA